MPNIITDGLTGDIILSTTKDITVKTKTVTLTDEQVKSLPSTPVVLLEQITGSGSIMILGGTIEIDSTAGAYSNFDGSGVTALQLRGMVQLPYSTLRSFLQSGNGEFILFPSQKYYKSTDIEVTSGNAEAGQPMQGYVVNMVDVYIDNFDSSYNTNLGNFTGGHPDNYIKITLVYSVIE